MTAQRWVSIYGRPFVCWKWQESTMKCNKRRRSMQACYFLVQSVMERVIQCLTGLFVIAGPPRETRRDISAVKLQHVSLRLASHPGPLRKHRVLKTASHARHLLEVSPLNHRWHSCMSRAVPEPDMDGDDAPISHIFTLFVLASGPQSHVIFISFKYQLAELLLTAVRLHFYTHRNKKFGCCVQILIPNEKPSHESGLCT